MEDLVHHLFVEDYVQNRLLLLVPELPTKPVSRDVSLIVYEDDASVVLHRGGDDSVTLTPANAKFIEKLRTVKELSVGECDADKPLDMAQNPPKFYYFAAVHLMPALQAAKPVRGMAP